MKDRTVSESLRALADFLDAHPAIDVREQNVTILKYVSTREELAAIARHGAWKKVYTNNYFELHHDCGNGVNVQVYTDRANEPVTLDSIERDAIMARAELRDLLWKAETPAACCAIAERAEQLAAIFQDVTRQALQRAEALNP